MCIKDLQTQVTYLFFLSRKKPKLTLTDYVIKLDVKAQKVKCQISHIIFVIWLLSIMKMKLYLLQPFIGINSPHLWYCYYLVQPFNSFIIQLNSIKQI